jgi:hypothetical protein
MKQKRRNILLAALLLPVSLAFACAGDSATPNRVSQAGSPAMAPASFINKVWKVKQSNGVAAGTLYVFLSEGTLVITSGQSKPALGSWALKESALTITEEAIPYKVEIVRLTRDEFAVRIHNPGTATEIEFAEAREPSPQGS